MPEFLVSLSAFLNKVYFKGANPKPAFFLRTSLRNDELALTSTVNSLQLHPVTGTRLRSPVGTQLEAATRSTGG